MAWIELHQAVWTHRKTFLLAAELDLEETYAAAHIIRLWTWALDNAPDGDVTGLPARVLAYGAAWSGDADAFVAALIASGWIDDGDGYCCLHDWDDYAGRLIERRAANAERMRNARAPREPSIKEPRAQNVRSTCAERAPATVPNRTVPDLTKPDQIDTAASAAERVPEKAAVQEIFEHYRARIQPQARTRADTQIKQRLKHFSADELKTAVAKFAADDWWMEHNANKGAPWFFKSDLRIEQFLNLTERANGRTNGNGHGPGARGAGGAGGGRTGPSRTEQLRAYRAATAVLPGTAGDRNAGDGAGGGAPPISAVAAT